jgi:RNA polymerase sigma factor (sigma-70 family)
MMFTGPTDVEGTLKELRAGSAAAERLFYEQWAPKVRTALRRRLPDYGAVAETTNDVLHVVIRAIRVGQVRNDLSLASYVLSVARNLANNYLRTHATRSRERPLPADFDAAVSHDERAEAERLEYAHDALELLEEEDRKLLLSLLAGVSASVLASQLGVSVEVVRARKCRAIKRLTGQLTAHREGRS